MEKLTFAMQTSTLINLYFGNKNKIHFSFSLPKILSNTSLFYL